MRRATRRDSTGTALALACLASVCVSGAQGGAPDVAARLGEYVQDYYSRARSLLVEETVVLQPLRHDLSPDGFARRLVYEVRVEWNPDAPPGEHAATVVRDLVKASGPSLGLRKPDCFDPRAVSPEPLAFLLPDRQGRLRFTMAGAARAGGRAALLLEFRPRAPEPPKVEWDEECGRIDLPGHTRGRIWVDAASWQILRYDEHLTGPVDIPGPRQGRRSPNAPLWFTVERADTSTEYRPVSFTDPVETLMLPARIDSVSVIRSSGIPRIRITQTYANYRRFITESRVLPSLREP